MSILESYVNAYLKVRAHQHLIGINLTIDKPLSMTLPKKPLS